MIEKLLENPQNVFQQTNNILTLWDVCYRYSSYSLAKSAICAAAAAAHLAVLLTQLLLLLPDLESYCCSSTRDISFVWVRVWAASVAMEQLPGARACHDAYAK